MMRWGRDGRHVWQMTVLLLHCAAADPAMSLSGDSTAWDKMFAARTPELLVSDNGLIWPEGPVWTDEGLLFSDTVTGIMWRWQEEAKKLEEFLTSAGGCPESNGEPWSCDPEQAEPGSNGMALLGNGSVVVCQHGARRLALLDLKSKRTSHLTGEFEGKRLNGPNDVVVHSSGDLIFTDPYYAFLEKSRFYDDNYTDAKSELGWAGIYRWSERSGDVKLLHSSMARPNGLALVPGRPAQLIVSECCQGHAPGCPQGMARWNIFQLRGERKMKLLHTVERRSAETFAGCADGFKKHPSLDFLVASCPQGLCVVDLAQRRVTVKLHMGFKVSNVAFGGGYLWITGEGRLWRIPLADRGTDEL